MGRKKKIDLYRCNDSYSIPQRVSKDFQLLVNQIKAKYLLEGRQPPSTARISQIIAKKIKKEDILDDDFIKL